MAQSAEELASLTRGQIVVTTFEVALLVVVLFYTVRATQQAVRSANAATRANEIQQQVLISSQRAWITITDIVPITDVTWKDDSIHIGIEIDAVNIGKTVAKSVYRTEDLSLFVSSQPRRQFDHLRRFDISRSDDVSLNMAPNETISFKYYSSTIISKFDLEHFGQNSEGVMISVAGRFLYKVFNDDSLHATEFLFLLRPDGRPFKIGDDIRMEDIKITRMFDGGLELT